MSVTYRVDFLKRRIRGKGFDIEKSIQKCHKFKYIESEDQEVLEIKSVPLDSLYVYPGKTVTVPHIYGPASCIQTKSIIYPCTRFRCSVPCPCLVCQHHSFQCSDPSKEDCECRECVKKFQDHNVFHQVLHLCCKLCREETGEAKEDELKSVEPLIFKHRYINSSYKNTHCYQCKYEFGSVADLRRHVCSIHYEEKLECEDCDKAFNRKENLLRHRKQFHTKSEVKLHNCKLCGKQFIRSDLLVRHKDIVHNASAFECNQCGAKFKRKDSLTKHVESQTDKDSLPINKCSRCGKIFCTFKQLEAHFVEHVNLECEHCEQAFKTKNYHNLHRHCNGLSEKVELKSEKVVIVKHRNNNSSYVNTECNQCSLKFQSLSDLRRHIRSIHDEEKFKCKDCDMVFKRKDNLLRHMKQFHEKSKIELLKCDKCEKQFTRSDLLARHKDIVHNASAFACNQCGAKFKRKDSLTKHVESQTDKDSLPINKCSRCDKIFCTFKQLEAHFVEHVNLECEHCEQAFKTKNYHNLHKHCNGLSEKVELESEIVVIVKHSNNNSSYVNTKCNQCSLNFRSLSDLRRHIRSIHEEEMFECKDCDMIFKRKDNLLRHMKQFHEKSKVELLKCDKCEKQFTRSDLLARHVDNFHEASYLKCKHCGARFKRKDALTRHIATRIDQNSFPKNQCSRCDKVFCTFNQLKTHFVEHDNLTCEHCEQVFKAKKYLKLHLKKQIVSDCEYCYKKFCNKRALDVHLLKACKDKPPVI